jgi:HEXXH motif-containing protein
VSGIISTWSCSFAIACEPEVERVHVAWRDGHLLFSLPGRDAPSLVLELKESRALEPDTLFTDGLLRPQFGVPVPNSAAVLRNDLPLLRLRLDPSVPPERDAKIELDLAMQEHHLYQPFDSDEFLRACSVLEATWPEQFHDFRELVHVVVPLVPPPGWELNGYTISTFQGACWIGTRGVVELLEHLVHELSHIKLRYVEEYQPLLEPRQVSERFAVDWRSDLRPMEGIFEGVYVGIHSSLALAKAAQAGRFDAIEQTLAERRALELHEQIEKALPILARHGRFTAAGAGFLDWARGMLDEQAPRRGIA